MTRPIESEKTYYHGLIDAKKIVIERMDNGFGNSRAFKNNSMCRCLTIAIIDRIDDLIYTWSSTIND
jgi:hypothetical protein